MPATEAMAFLPQRPYLPLGTLRNVVTYPSAPDTVPDEQVRAALRRCDLGQYLDRLDTVERWDKEFSLGEQERLAFARLLIHKPSWVFLDEATAALDADSQRHLMSLFDDELRHSTVLSIGHRPDLAEYHSRTVQLVHAREGASLRIKPPTSSLALNLPNWLREWKLWRWR
jgi:putative ATP-binding cassette transporter